MASVDSQLIEEVTAHAQSDSLEDAREICADGTYFPNNLHSLFMALKFDDRREIETLFSQLGVEEGKDLGKICFAPLVAAGNTATVEDCAVQSVWGYLKNDHNLPDNYIDTIIKCTQ